MQPRSACSQTTSCLKYFTSVGRITTPALDVEGSQRYGIGTFWYTVHVCRRWQQIVFASPFRLNIQLLCTYGTHVRKHLNIWPTFPINIEYLGRRDVGGTSEDNVIAALEQPDRVSAVSLLLKGLQIRRIAMVMQKPFPELRPLWLWKYHRSNDIRILPSGFLGDLRHVYGKFWSAGIAFPALPAFLLSTSNLVTLSLLDIPHGS